MQQFIGTLNYLFIIELGENNTQKLERKLQSSTNSNSCPLLFFKTFTINELIQNENDWTPILDHRMSNSRFLLLNEQSNNNYRKYVSLKDGILV